MICNKIYDAAILASRLFGPMPLETTSSFIFIFVRKRILGLALLVFSLNNYRRLNIKIEIKFKQIFSCLLIFINWNSLEKLTGNLG